MNKRKFDETGVEEIDDEDSLGVKLDRYSAPLPLLDRVTDSLDMLIDYGRLRAVAVAT
jgi:hypothetical protein